MRRSKTVPGQAGLCIHVNTNLICLGLPSFETTGTTPNVFWNSSPLVMSSVKFGNVPNQTKTFAKRIRSVPVITRAVSVHALSRLNSQTNSQARKPRQQQPLSKAKPNDKPQPKPKAKEIIIPREKAQESPREAPRGLERSDTVPSLFPGARETIKKEETAFPTKQEEPMKFFFLLSKRGIKVFLV